MPESVTLRGITWNHDRGLKPLVATAAAYAERVPNVRVEWQVRSLQAFADQDVASLAERFDLIVLDHPSIGFAVERECLVPLDRHLDRAFVEDQERNSVGRSHDSYVWDDHLWALAIDAAAQVASYRPDLLKSLGVRVPATWVEVLQLADVAWEGGYRVALPLIAVDAILSYLALCVADGIDPFDGRRDSRAELLEQMWGFVLRSHPMSGTWNPPRMYEHMAATDEVVYCPLGFGYSNYSRPRYRQHRLAFGPAPSGSMGLGVGTLGGAGIAVSASSRDIDVAVAYAAFVASPDVQRGIYVREQGQPGHRLAWTDDEANRLTSDYFRDALPGLDTAYLRPRHAGFLEFQDRAGDIVHEFLNARQTGALDVIDRLDVIWDETRGSTGR
jgi:multiple sugar transport system substrate-binding protein